MEHTKLLKASWVLYTAFLVVAMVPTAINIVRPLDFFVAGSYEAWIGESWRTFAVEQPKQAALYEDFCRFGAIGWLSTIVLALFITLGAYRRAERWAWIALIVGLVASDATAAIICLKIGDMMGVLFWTSWLCAGLVILLLPAREMLSQKAFVAKSNPVGALGQVPL